MKTQKLIRIDLTTEDMQAAVKAYVQPKIDEMFSDEIAKGTKLEINHPYIEESYVSVSVQLK